MNDKILAHKVLIIELLISLLFSIIIFMIGKYIILMNISGEYLIYLENCKLYLVYISFLIGYTISILFINPISNLFEKRYLKKYEKSLKDISFDYYRDIIKNYSVATICKCYGKKVRIEDQLVANLLSLKLNGYIEFDGENINIKNEFAKYKSEIILLKALKGLKIYTKENIKNQIDQDSKNDCLNSDLFINDKLSSTSKLKNSMYNFNIILWLFNFICLFFINYLPLVIIMFVFHFVLLFIIIFGGKNDKTIFVRNDKGIELQRKLCGLKGYLQDFGNINEKEIRELKLYEDYIIYAIIFDLKGNLNNEANELYEKYIKNLIYK